MNAAYANADALVIGGGPAGSMVALRLAAAGRAVVLVEREAAAHHKVCGEFLSREAVEYLAQAGVAPRAMGASVVEKLRLSAGNKVIETSLPFQALSLSRRALDEALLGRAAESGCNVLRGITVEGLAVCGDGWRATLGDGRQITAATVFLASGKHEMRGWSRPAGKQNDLVGFKMHWRLQADQIEALRGTMDLYLFDGGYGGIALVEGEAANLCLVVQRAVLRRHGGWPQLLAAILTENRHLRELLQDAKTDWERPLAVSPIPYGYLAEPMPGAWRVGDQAAVIPSFTGDGISIALHSAALAAKMHLEGANAIAYQQTLNMQLHRAMTLATWLSRAAVTGPGRATAVFAGSLFPHVMQSIAAATRIPQAAVAVARDWGAHCDFPAPASDQKRSA
jgi:menaquinone-9 beta-reductase